MNLFILKFHLTLLEDLYNQFIVFVPNILGALAILLIGLIIVGIISRFLRKVLNKAGIDKLADKSINKIDMLESNNIRLVPSTLISKIVYYSLLLIIIIAATDALQMEAISNLVASAVDYVPSLITAIALLVVGLLIADFVRDVILAAMQSLNVPAAKFIASFLFYFIFISVLMVALEQAKIGTDFITANLSIILGGVMLAFAIGYGFSSRALMSSYIAYFYNRNKVNVGDILKIDGKEGVVTSMDNTTLTLASIDGESRIIIPLSKLSTETIEIKTKL